MSERAQRDTGILRSGRGRIPGRIPGVDLARGLAVFGMFAAHLLTIAPFDPADPATWIDVANGRSSILFATLAGVSIALVTGGARPIDGAALSTARRRLVVRAILLWVIGALLISTGVPVYVILPAYALLFLIALPLLRLSARMLWIIAAVIALVVPWLLPWLNALPVWEGETGGDLALILGWHYPFPLWSAFVVAGMAAGRADLRSRRTAWLLTAGGLVAAIAAAAASAVPALAALDPRSILGQVLADDAHSGGLLEVIGSGGGALATIGACVLLCRTRANGVLLPLRAVGSMPLTAYVGQLVAWALIAAAVLGDTGDLLGFRALQPFWPFVLVTLAACTAWALLLGRGPLERLLGWVAHRVAP